MAETTNAVEGLHGIRRKFASKRLNFALSYECRANIALLDAHLEKWIEVVLKELNFPISEQVSDFLKVHTVDLSISHHYRRRKSTNKRRVSNSHIRKTKRHQRKPLRIPFLAHIALKSTKPGKCFIAFIHKYLKQWKMV